MPTTSPTPVDVTKSTLPYQDVTLSNIKDLSPDITALVGSIRFDTINSMSNTANSRNNLLDKLFPDSNKIDLTTEVPLEATHEQLNDGTWIPRYESYMPGVDNDTRLSAQQGDWEKFFNPIKRFMSNTGKAPLDLLSGVYGIGAAALTGRFDAIYDNDFAHYVDDLTTRTNSEYKNYYNEKERNQDLGLNMQTWDKVLGGAEFTARMLASEAIIAVLTDGASLPSSFAKIGLKSGLSAAGRTAVKNSNEVLEVGRDIAKMLKIAQAPELSTAVKGANVANSGSRMLGALETAANRGKLADNLVKARFAITSPMYEAGFEARHFQKEAEQQFWDYYNERGIQPTPEEVNAFAGKLAGATNGVFMANMAILAPSNLAMVGDFVNLKNPLSKWVTGGGEGITRNLFKIGTEVGEDGAYRALKAGFWNKTAAYATPFIKGALVEGVYEEGTQGIASNTYKNYVASSYDPEAMKSTANYIDSFGKAFKDQFGTKEGMEEVLIGALIGGLMGGVGGARNTAREYRAQNQIAGIQNAGLEFTDNLRSNIYTNEQLLSLFSSANRFQNIRQQLENANEQGNKLEEASLQAQSFISLLDAYNSVGKGNEFTDMVKNVFMGIDNQYVADSTGLNIEQVDAFKTEQVQDMTDLADKYTTALEAGRYLFGNKVGGFTEVDIDGKKTKVSGQNLANALAFSSTMALFNEKYASETFSAFQTKLAQLSAGNDIVEKMGAIGAIKKASEVELEKYYSLNQEESQLKTQLNKIADRINQLNASEEKANAATERVELANKLIEVQNQINDVTGTKDVLWKSMVDNFYSKIGGAKYAPQIDLDTFNKQVKDIESALDNANYSASDKLVLNQLLDQFDNANNAYKSFTNMANRIADPKFSFKTYNQLFGGLRAKFDKSINDHTRETLLQLYGQGRLANQMMNDTVDSLERAPSPVTQEVVNSDSIPSEDILAYLKDQLKNRRKLTANEQQVYDQYKDEVDNYQSQDEIDPLNSTSDATIIDDLTVKRNAIQAELDNLDNGVYSDELQRAIDELEDSTSTATTENLITNLDDIIANGSGRLEIQNRQGESVAFDMFDIVVDTTDNTAEVAYVKKRDRTSNKGIAYEAYIELGNRLAEQGITLQTPSGNKLTGGLDLWNRLVKEGYATGNNRTGYTFIGKSEGVDAITERVEQERLRLEDDLAVLNGEINTEERRERLQNELNSIRDEVMEEETIDTSKIKRMNILQRELNALDNVKTPFNANGTPFEQLSWIINNISDLNFETVDDLATIQRPTQDVVDEYINLLKTKNRNTTQRARLAELRKELLPFNLAEGLSLDGVNVLDIINLYNQNQNIQEVNETQLAELPEDTLKNVIKDVKQVNDREEFRSAKVGLVYDGAYIERKKNGYKIYHVKLNTMLEQSLNAGFSPEITVYGEDSKGKRTVVEEIAVTPENMQELGNRFDGQDNIKVRLSEDSAVTKNKGDKSFYVNGDVNTLLDLIGASPYAITGQPTNYVLLYKTNTDGSMQPREAEFTITNQGVEMNFDKEALNSVKPGDDVTLEFDLNDDFNKNLSKEDYNSQGRIYVKKNGKLVNILKGTDVAKSGKDSWTELEAIRRKAVRAGTSKKSKTVKIKVSDSYLGFPIVPLNADGTAREIPIDESKVAGFGYMDENGNLQGDIARLKIDNIQYITPLSTLGKKTPVMAFNAYGQVIAFPINIKPQGIDLSADVDTIVNDDTLTRERKIFEINALLENNGLFNADTALSNANFDINKVKQTLSAVNQSVDITDKDQFDNADKTAFIDLNDPFKSSKLVFDFGSIQEELLNTEKDAKEANKETTSTNNKKGKNKADENKC
jgi:hypothetical protein